MFIENTLYNDKNLEKNPCTRSDDQIKNLWHIYTVSVL